MQRKIHFLIWPILCIWGILGVLAGPAMAAEEDFGRAQCAKYLRHMQQIHRDSFYTDHRDLHEYTSFLGPSFDAAIAALRPHEVWLDSGAGTGVALMEYLKNYAQGGKVVGTGVVLKDDPGHPWQEMQEQYPQRIYFQAGMMERGPTERWEIFGKYQLITDVFGPLIYSHRIDRIMRRYGELLAPGGMLMATIDINNILIIDRWRVAHRVQEWILAMQGWELLEDHLFFQENDAFFLPIILRRTYDDLVIPPLRPLMDNFSVGCPPRRAFLWEGVD